MQEHHYYFCVFQFSQVRFNLTKCDNETKGEFMMLHQFVIILDHFYVCGCKMRAFLRLLLQSVIKYSSAKLLITNNELQ